MVTAKQITLHVKEKKILDDISFEANQGDFISILGQNGAGKSSLLRCLSGTETGFEGDVLVNGRPIKLYSNQEMALMRSVLTQKQEMAFDYSVEEIIGFGRYINADEAFVHETLVDLGLQGLEKRSYFSLSGGEQQRVRIAQAIVQIMPDLEGKFILLDEPLTHLDLKHQYQVLDLLQKMSKEGGALVITVMHDINLSIQWSNKVLLMKNGRNVAFGNMNEVVNSKTLSDTYELPLKLNENGDSFRIKHK